MSSSESPTSRRRFRCASTDELLERAAAARAELAALDADGDPESAARELLAAAEAAVAGLARRAAAQPGSEAAPRLAAAVAGELRDLGMGDGEFRVELAEQQPSPSGTDRVAFLIRPNRASRSRPSRKRPRAVSSRASRWRSRLRQPRARRMIFDEIDAGIGGETANAVGRALRRLAERAQVVTITHLPQIAGLADRHFRVEKVPGDPTHTTIHALGEDERREELERMLGGREFAVLLAGSDAP